MSQQLALLDAPGAARPAEASGYLAIRIEVPGEIVPWARARLGQRGIPYTPARQRDYGAVLRDAASQAMAGRPPLDGPCAVTIVATWAWPATWSRPKRARSAGLKASAPDADNVGKIVKDALTGIAYTDDARIARLLIEKRYADRPSIHVTVSSLT